MATAGLYAFKSVWRSGGAWPAIAISPFLSGIAVHLAVRPFEIDTHTLELLSIYMVTLITSFLALYLHGGLDVAGSLTTVLLVASSFNTGLFTSILVYRAFFHRLHRFPGPFLSKLSRFRALKVATQTKQTHLAIERIHQEYGDFVRVGTLTTAGTDAPQLRSNEQLHRAPRAGDTPTGCHRCNLWARLKMRSVSFVCEPFARSFADFHAGNTRSCDAQAAKEGLGTGAGL